MDIATMTSLAINIAIAALSVYAWLCLMFGWGKSGGLLADRGIMCLRYFTVLSNLFSGIVSLVCAVTYLFSGSMLPAWLLTLKLISATCVMLTFLVALFILVPAYDLKSMYMGSNFWMHLVLPLLAAADCCLFVPVGTLPWQTTFLAFIPCILYGLFYLQGILRHGEEENGIVYDFYHFLRWGTNKIPVVFALALLSVWGIAVVLRGLSALIGG